MAKKSDAFGKFVRLNLIGETVEVASVDSAGITIKYHGNHITMKHWEVSHVTPDEEAAAASQVGKLLKRKADEELLFFRTAKTAGDGPTSNE
jgi:hypothetical protein